MKMEVPFYSQCWDLDAWKDQGYASRKEAEYWQRSSCGILCALMVMNGLRDGSVQHTMKELIDVGVANGAYTDATGWSHEGIVKLVGSFSFEARRGSFSREALRGPSKRQGLSKRAFSSGKGMGVT